MTSRENTLWEQFLKPIVRSLIDEEALQKFYESMDWEAEKERFARPDLAYPEYYRSQNFHGIEGGYLAPGAAVSYDPITQYFLPPGETWVRQEVINSVAVHPQKILDLGCGTGSMTLKLKQAFPQAEVFGLDLSPYMLVMADYKAQQTGLEIRWLHGKAEKTQFRDEEFDLVTACLLFHETPPTITTDILAEAFRILKPGGQFLMLDGNQVTLHQVQWLTEIFEEPYIKAFAAGDMDRWLNGVGFEAVQTRDFWWIHQISSGIKPLPSSDFARQTPSEASKVDDWGTSPAPA